MATVSPSRARGGTAEGILYWRAGPTSQAVARVLRMAGRKSGLPPAGRARPASQQGATQAGSAEGQQPAAVQCGHGLSTHRFRARQAPLKIHNRFMGKGADLPYTIVEKLLF